MKKKDSSLHSETQPQIDLRREAMKKKDSSLHSERQPQIDLRREAMKNGKAVFLCLSYIPHGICPSDQREESLFSIGLFCPSYQREESLFFQSISSDFFSLRTE
jgi:hypothetical protein